MTELTPPTPPEGLSEFEKRLWLREQKEAAEKAAHEATQQAAEPAVTVPDDVIPEVIADHVLSEAEQALDDAIKNWSIVDAYKRLCGKSKVNTHSGRKKEGIKVSCPNPAHPDKDPSAWLNTEKNVYYCGGCDIGGDVWDIAAWYFHYPVPGYKKDKAAFRELRTKIGELLGFSAVITEVPTETEPETEPETPTQAQPVPAQRETTEGQTESPTEPLATVTKLPAAITKEIDDEDREEELNAPTIDWRSLVPEETFLRSWLVSTTQDRCPEEYHFWTGLMAVGFAVGRNRVLADFRPVVPNLFVCLVGPSGAGKSIAKSHLTRVVADALPYDYRNPLSMGTKFVSSPGSAEYVVKALSVPIPDPVEPKKILGYAPVRAQIDFEELASLVRLSQRIGSTIKPTLIELYDAAQLVGSGSLTHGERQAHNPFAQVTTTTQPGALAGLLGKDDEISGFMNRWVFVQGRLKPQLSMGGVEIDLTEPTHLLQQIHRWSAKPTRLSLDPDAFKLWDEYFHSVVVPLKNKSEESGSALLNRIDLLFKKLMILFACNSLRDSVTLEDVRRATDLFPYILATFGRTGSRLTETPESTAEERILRFIRKNTRERELRQGNEVVKQPLGPTASEIHVSLKGRGGSGLSRNEINRLLDDMVKAGFIGSFGPIGGLKGGPTTYRYTASA